MRTLFSGGLIATLILASAQPVWADYISDTLGAAGPSNYAILTTATSPGINNSSDTGVNGNIGVANPSGVVKISGGGATEVTGNIYLAGNTPVNIGGPFTGTAFYNQSQLAGASNAAVNAANTFAGLAATQSVPGNAINLTSGSQTITAANPGGLNVLNLSSIKMGNGTTLTLSGPAGTQFVINSSGGISMNGGNGQKIALAGGLTASDVVFNVTGGGVTTTGGGNASQINGIVMALTSDIGLHPGNVNGEIIAGANFTTSSGAVINGTPTVPAPPSAVLLGIGGLVFAAVVARSRRLPVPVNC